MRCRASLCYLRFGCCGILKAPAAPSLNAVARLRLSMLRTPCAVRVYVYVSMTARICHMYVYGCMYIYIYIYTRMHT